MSSNVGGALGAGQPEASDVSSLEAVSEIAALLRRSHGLAAQDSAPQERSLSAIYKEVGSTEIYQ
jgi:hypothetical protein